MGLIINLKVAFIAAFIVLFINPAHVQSQEKDQGHNDTSGNAVDLRKINLNLSQIKIADPTEKLLQEFSKRISQFSSVLYEQVNEDYPVKNFVLSAFCIQTVLALLTFGAEYITLYEINKAIHIPNVEFTKAVFPPTLQRLNNYTEDVFSIYNLVYIIRGARYEIDPEFNHYAENVFFTDIRHVRFNRPTEADVEIINWSRHLSHKEFKILLAPNSGPKLVLVSLIDFSAKWKTSFNPLQTRLRDFHEDHFKSKQVPMMYRTGRILYANIPELDAKMVKLPYRGDAWMVIILPNNIEGLKEVERKIGSANLTHYIKNLVKPTKIGLTLPKATITTRLHLKSQLRKLGIHKAFSPSEADLTGILRTNHNVYLEDVVHVAHIGIHEYGSRAVQRPIHLSYPEPKAAHVTNVPTFNADHPFYFTIRDNVFNELLNGRVTKL